MVEACLVFIGCFYKYIKHLKSVAVTAAVMSMAAALETTRLANTVNFFEDAA